MFASVRVTHDFAFWEFHCVVISRKNTWCDALIARGASVSREVSVHGLAVYCLLSVFFCVFGGVGGGFRRRPGTLQRNFYSRMQIQPKHSWRSTLFIFVAIGILQKRSIWWPWVALCDAMTVFSWDFKDIFILPTLLYCIFYPCLALSVWGFFLRECIRPHFEDLRRLCMKLANQGRLLWERRMSVFPSIGIRQRQPRKSVSGQHR